MTVGPSNDWAAPWFAPYRPLLETLDLDLAAHRWPQCIAQLNDRAHDRGLVNDNGKPLRFVAPDVAGDSAYEAHIWQTGNVPTRRDAEGAWHDFFNALVWLTFPRIKARLNALQAGQIAAMGAGRTRGSLRDAATLFDENGALLVTADRELVAALRRFDWRTLFVEDRARFSREVQVIVFGHALLDKLRAPYKAACAHVWVVDAAEGAALDACRVDDRTAQALDPGSLHAGVFAPLPVLGIPGWWSANDDLRFYEDPRVFRSGRVLSRRGQDGVCP